MVEKIYIAILDRPEMSSVRSLYAAAAATKGAQFYIATIEGDTTLPRIRDNQASEFLRDFPDFNWFFQMDADIEVPPDIFKRLYLAANGGTRMVGALYSSRNEGAPWATCSMELREGEKAGNDGMLDMLWMSGGCWLVHRSIMQAVAEASVEYIGDGENAGKKVWGMFQPTLVQRKDGTRKWIGEDWSFCQRVQRCGYRIVADTTIKLVSGTGA